ncbi:MAG: hypothetical protein K5660_07315 [Paludibacteraceae bacterium]|nr:hypothetical protein [Paludibacteraceae bacterium]
MYIATLIWRAVHISVDVIVCSCDRVISGTSLERISVDNIHALLVYSVSLPVLTIRILIRYYRDCDRHNTRCTQTTPRAESTNKD